MSATETLYQANTDAQATALATALANGGKTYTTSVNPIGKDAKPYRMGVDGRRFLGTASDNSEQFQFYITKPKDGDGKQTVFMSRVDATGKVEGVRMLMDGSGKISSPEAIGYNAEADRYGRPESTPDDITKYIKDNGLDRLFDAAHKAGIVPLKWDDASPKKQAALTTRPASPMMTA